MREYAAHKLCNTRNLLSDGKCLPKIFVVNEHCYWYLNAAKRAAYGTNHPIEMLTINEAFEIVTRLPATAMKHDTVAWEFDQTGDIYLDNLFCDNMFVKPFMVKNEFVGSELVTEVNGNVQKKEKELITEALKRCEYKKVRTAQYLGLSVHTLTKKMNEYNIKIEQQ